MDVYFLSAVVSLLIGRHVRDSFLAAVLNILVVTIGAVVAAKAILGYYIGALVKNPEAMLWIFLYLTSFVYAGFILGRLARNAARLAAQLVPEELGEMGIHKLPPDIIRDIPNLDV